jgi:Holliday junction resolvase RusA-like endonuclease
MSSCKVVIPITPKPKASVQLARGRAFNPSARGMGLVTSYVRQRFIDQPMPLLKGPLLVIVHFVLPAPLSLPQRKRELQNCRPHTKKPDADNLEKFLNDALTGVVWDDDARVVWMLRSKTITSEKQGYTIFYAQEISDEEPDYHGMLETIREHIYIDKGETHEIDG